MNRQTLTRKIKFLYRGVASSTLIKIFKRKGYDAQKTIIILGSTRSGSTWLAELISSVPGHIQIFEPMNAQYIKPARDINIERNMYLTKEDSWQEGAFFFNRIFSGKLVNPWLCSQIKPKEVISSNRLVVKFVRGNMLLDWMLHNMSVLPPALVVRHPCAVIASQLHKGWTPNLKVLLNNRFFNDFPQFKEPCSALKGNEKISALAWCIRYYAPLAMTKPYPYLLVSYEGLVRNGEQELKRLFDAWDLPFTDDIKQRLFKPSNTIAEGSEIIKGRDPLAGWQKKLSSQQVDDILSVLEIFGLDFYDRSLEPNYDKLNNFQAVKPNES